MSTEALSMLAAKTDIAVADDRHTAVSKKQLKRQKKQEKWLQIKALKRASEKVKRKQRLAKSRQTGEDMRQTRKSLKRNTMKDSSCHQRVVIDCSFDSYMSGKDTTFLVQQIQNSYAANRRAQNPLQFYVCGLEGKALKRLDSIGDYKGWDLHATERSFHDLFSKDEIVYLSSESPNLLDTLDESKVYIIGGLVDHNHHKGLCYRLAQERGFAHAQLPIGQFLQLKSRKVLTINHVFEILLRFTESKDWQKSFIAVLPQRKGLTVKKQPAVNQPEISNTTHPICVELSEVNSSNGNNLNQMENDSGHDSSHPSQGFEIVLKQCQDGDKCMDDDSSNNSSLGSQGFTVMLEESEELSADNKSV